MIIGINLVQNYISDNFPFDHKVVQSNLNFYKILGTDQLEARDGLLIVGMARHGQAPASPGVSRVEAVGQARVLNFGEAHSSRHNLLGGEVTHAPQRLGGEEVKENCWY